MEWQLHCSGSLEMAEMSNATPAIWCRTLLASDLMIWHQSEVLGSQYTTRGCLFRRESHWEWQETLKAAMTGQIELFMEQQKYSRIWKVPLFHCFCILNFTYRMCLGRTLCVQTSHVTRMGAPETWKKGISLSSAMRDDALGRSCYHSFWKSPDSGPGTFNHKGWKVTTRQLGLSFKVYFCKVSPCGGT